MFCFNNQCVIDWNGLFRDVFCGLPGNYHDLKLLRVSPVHIHQDRRFTRRINIRDLNDIYNERLFGDRVSNRIVLCLACVHVCVCVCTHVCVCVCARALIRGTRVLSSSTTS
jgi:hypothetical protein